MTIVNVSHTETKWTWLQKRLAGAQAEVDALAGQIQGLAAQPFDGECLTCGFYMATEADFARHYIVPDPRYLNMGECPTKFGHKVENGVPVVGASEPTTPVTHVLDSDGILKSTERTYADVVGPYKDALYPEGM